VAVGGSANVGSLLAKKGSEKGVRALFLKRALTPFPRPPRDDKSDCFALRARNDIALQRSPSVAEFAEFQEYDTGIRIIADLGKLLLQARNH